jgi:hypothetical protein
MPVNKTTTRKNSNADWLPSKWEDILAMAMRWREAFALKTTAPLLRQGSAGGARACQAAVPAPLQFLFY